MLKQWLVTIVAVGLLSALAGAEVVVFDDFSDNDTAGWTVVQGAVRADGVSVPNLHPVAGQMNFLNAGTTEVYTDWPTTEPNSIVHAEASFRLRQSNDASPASYAFTFGFRDTVSGQEYYEQATLNPNFYGVSGGGFHSWNTANQIIGGLDPNAHLTNGWNDLRMVFDTITGVQVYHNEKLVAQWSNYKNIEQVDQFYFLVNATDGMSWFVDDVIVRLTEPYTLWDRFTDGDYTSNPAWTVNSGTFDASAGYLSFGKDPGGEIQLDFDQFINDYDTVRVDLLLFQDLTTGVSYNFHFLLEDADSGLGFHEQGYCTNAYGGAPNYSGFHARNSAGQIILGEPTSYGRHLGQTYTVWSKITMVFDPFKGFEFWFKDELMAKWANFDNLKQVNRLRLRRGNDELLPWRVDDVLVTVQPRPLIVDTFSDNDYTTDPTWVVDAGTFAADGTNIGNYQPRAGALNFGTAAGTRIHLNVPQVQDNTPFSAEFDLLQSNGAFGGGYRFRVELMDSQTGEFYYQNATLQPTYYGTSGFHSFNTAGELIAGAAGKSLVNGTRRFGMSFDPLTGVQVTYAGEVVASWPNFKNLTRVDTLYLENHGPSGVSWFVDNVAVDAQVYDPQFCGDDGTVYLPGDITQDCQVAMVDLAVMASQWLECTTPWDPDCRDYSGDSYLIPQGTAVVDGDLSDWADALWMPLDQPYYGFGTDVPAAFFAARWDPASNRVFVAIDVTDLDQNFEDSPSGWNTSDRIEVYSQGSGVGGGNYSANQDFAQQYVLGVTASDNNALWTEFGNGNPDVGAGYADLLYAGSADALNNRIVYELGIKQYENYGGISGGATTVRNLAAGDVVRLDVIVGTLLYNDFLGAYEYGMWAENTVGGKFSSADSIAAWTLAGDACGTWGYAPADVNADCVVDMHDFAALAAHWMQCSDPADPACDEFWK